MLTMRRGFVRDGYMMADEILAVGRDLLGPEATTLLVSPWGLAPSWLAVNAGKVLVDAGIAEAEQPENCVPGPVTAATRHPRSRGVARRTGRQDLLVGWNGPRLHQPRRAGGGGLGG